MKANLWAVVAAVACLSLGAGEARADVHQCREAKAKGDASVAEYYNPRIAQLDELATKGVKLADIKVKVPYADGHEDWLTLAEVKDRLNAEKVLAAQHVTEAVDECERGFKP